MRIDLRESFGFVLVLLAAIAIGCDSSVQGDPAYLGTWEGQDLKDDVGSDDYVDVLLVLGADESYSICIYEAGTTTLRGSSNRGTYAVGKGGKLYAVATECYDDDEGEWVDYWGPGFARYELDGDTMYFHIDVNSDGVMDLNWALERQ